MTVAVRPGSDERQEVREWIKAVDDSPTAAAEFNIRDGLRDELLPPKVRGKYLFRI